MATYKVLADSITTTKKQVVGKGSEIPDFWLPKENIPALIEQKIIEEVKPPKPAEKPVLDPK